MQISLGKDFSTKIADEETYLYLKRYAKVTLWTTGEKKDELGIFTAFV